MKIFLSVRKSQIRELLGSFRNRKSTNFWCVPVHKLKNRIFPWSPSPQIANLQICKAKSRVFDPDPHWFASNIFFTYVRNSLDCWMPCNSKLFQKPKVFYKLEEKTFSAYICKDKNYVFADFRSFKFAKNNWVRKSQIRKSKKILNMVRNRKSTNCNICGRSANLTKN